MSFFWHLKNGALDVPKAVMQFFSLPSCWVVLNEKGGLCSGNHGTILGLASPFHICYKPTRRGCVLWDYSIKRMFYQHEFTLEHMCWEIKLSGSNSQHHPVDYKGNPFTIIPCTQSSSKDQIKTKWSTFIKIKRQQRHLQ